MSKATKAGGKAPIVVEPPWYEIFNYDEAISKLEEIVIEAVITEACLDKALEKLYRKKFIIPFAASNILTSALNLVNVCISEVDKGENFDDFTNGSSWLIEKEPISNPLDGRARASVHSKKRNIVKGLETRPGSSVTIHNLASRGSILAGSRGNNNFSRGTFALARDSPLVKGQSSHDNRTTHSSHSLANENGVFNMNISVSSTVYRKVYGDRDPKEGEEKNNKKKKQIPHFVKSAQDAGYVVKFEGIGRGARYVVHHDDDSKERAPTPPMSAREIERRRSIMDELDSVQSRIDAIAARIAAHENAEKEWKMLKKELKGKSWTLDKNGDIIVINKINPENMGRRLYSLRNLIKGEKFHPLRIPEHKQLEPPNVDLSQCYKDNQQPSLINTISLSSGVSLYDKGFVIDGDPFLEPQNHRRRYQTPSLSQLVTLQPEKPTIEIFDDDDESTLIPHEIVVASRQLPKVKVVRKVDDEISMMARSPKWGEPCAGFVSLPSILPSQSKHMNNSLSNSASLSSLSSILSSTLKTNTRGYVENPIRSIQMSKHKRQRKNGEMHKRVPNALEIVKTEIEERKTIPGSHYGSSSYERSLSSTNEYTSNNLTSSNSQSEPQLYNSNNNNSSQTYLQTSPISTTKFTKYHQNNNHSNFSDEDPIARTSKFLKHLEPKQIASNIVKQISLEAIDSVKIKFPSLSQSINSLTTNVQRKKKMMKISTQKSEAFKKYLGSHVNSVTANEEMLDKYLPLYSPKNKGKTKIKQNV